jgi:hypothetical protein
MILIKSSVPLVSLLPVLLSDEATFTSQIHWQQADQWHITGIKNVLTFQVVF